MEVCENLSNSSATDCHQVMPSSDLTAFVFVLAIACVPVAIFTVLTVVLLLQSSLVAITVRVPLMNLLVVTLITNIVFLCMLTSSAGFVLSNATDPPLQLCQFAVWFYSISVAARLLGQVIFSVLMFQTATCGRRKIQVKWLMCSLVASWVIALVSRVHLLVPGIYGFSYVGGIACFLTAGYPEYEVLRLTMNVLSLMLAFLHLLICICIPLATFCYIKCYTISEGAQYKKAMAKFATFLITESALNVFGVAVPRFLGDNFSATINSGVVYLSYTIILLSFIPTPILIIVFLKPVQKRLCHLFCSKYHKDNETIPMQQADRPE